MTLREKKPEIPEWQSRTELLLGREAVKQFSQTHVLVAGLGGVGAAAAEMICRAGIGHITLADHDLIQPSNRNRLLIADSENEGQFKTDVLAAKLKNINSELKISIFSDYIDKHSIPALLDQPYNYIIDAIDTLNPKALLIEASMHKGIGIVSALGAAGRLDPSQVHVDDIAASNGCRFGYYLRKKLHKQGIRTGFKVVYSTEVVPRTAVLKVASVKNKKSVTGTISYMPVIFGALCASVVINEMAGSLHGKPGLK